MFSVKWVAQGHESQPIEASTSAEKDLDSLFYKCREKLPSMIQRHSKNPPDGFLILDATGREVRRWLEVAD